MNTYQEKELELSELEQYILNTMKAWSVPGLAIALVKNGKTLLVRGYGTCETGREDPVNEHSLFAISSATQTFTASAIGLLVDEGKLDWNDRLIDVLPSFKTGCELVTHHATVIDALANRTGLGDETFAYVADDSLSRGQILDQMQYLQASTEFRSQWSFNTHMAVATGEIIPALTGVSWDEFVRDRLFKPTGMTDSLTGPHLLTKDANVATPHEFEDEKMIPVGHANTSAVGPAVSIYSSASDMAKWLNVHLNNGKIGDKTILPEEQLDIMRCNHMATNFPFPGIAHNFLNQGLGLVISDGAMGCKILSNGGGSEGMEFYHALVPELNLGVAVMVNARIAMPQRLVAWTIDRYTQAPSRDWAQEILPVFAERRAAMLAGFEREKQALIDRSAKPRFSLSAYEGCYRHPLFGSLSICLEGDSLCFTLGTRYRGKLEHVNHDTFFVCVDSPLMGRYLLSGPAQFYLDAKGQLSVLSIGGKDFQKVEMQ